jgi:iron(III) transport system ATP-binding protein
LFPAPGLPDGSEAIVAIRPQGVQLRPPGLCIPGMLEHRRFLGVVELLDIAVSGLDAPLKARVRQSAGFAVKSEVGVEIDPAEVLVFAAAGA